MEVVPASSIATRSALIRDFDLLTMAASEQDIVRAPFALEPLPPAAAEAAAAADGASTAPAGVTLHGLTLWFDIGFDGRTKPARGTTAPAAAADADAPPLESTADDGDVPALEESAPAAAAPASRAPEVAHAFSTSPAATPTHWAQTTFLFHEPLLVPAGATVAGFLTMVRDAVNPREYRFIVDLPSASPPRSYTYHMH